MNQLSQLPVSERLDLVQHLWDSIGESQAELPIHDWHRELVKARLAERKDKTGDPGISREEVWRQVEERRGS